jgi:5-methylcytosine-specific restriction protein A
MRTPDTRPSAHRRGYTRKWYRTQGAYLYRHSTCEDCGQPATEAHHRDGKGPNGPLGHKWTNLMPLCKACHSKRTAQEQPGGWHNTPKKKSPAQQHPGLLQ